MSSSEMTEELTAEKELESRGILISQPLENLLLLLENRLRIPSQFFLFPIAITIIKHASDLDKVELEAIKTAFVELFNETGEGNVNTIDDIITRIISLDQRGREKGMKIIKW